MASTTDTGSFDGNGVDSTVWTVVSDLCALASSGTLGDLGNEIVVSVVGVDGPTGKFTESSVSP